MNLTATGMVLTPACRNTIDMELIDEIPRDAARVAVYAPDPVNRPIRIDLAMGISVSDAVVSEQRNGVDTLCRNVYVCHAIAHEAVV